MQTLARLGPAIFLVQLLGFGSSVALATQLGATTQTDAYFLALTVPFFTYSILLSAVRQGAVPSLTVVAHGEPRESFTTACRQFVSGTVATAALLSLCVTAAMLVLLPIVAGANHHLVDLARQYMIELSPYAVTGGALGALGAILAVKRSFVIPALMLGCEPLLKCALVLLFPGLGAQALVIASVAGNLIAALVLWVLVVRRGIPLRFVRFHSSPLLRTIVTLTIPLAVGQSVLQFNPLIDRTLAAGLGTGNVTAFDIGARLFTAPANILGTILTAPLTATWSARLATEGWVAVTRSFRRVASAAVMIAAPLTVIGFLLRRDLVGLIYSSHAYNTTAVARTGDVFGLLLIGLLAQILVTPLSTLFLVRGANVFQMKMAFLNAALNTLLDLLLRGPLGVGGIAFSTTLTYIIVCLAYFREAHRRWSLDLRSLIRPIAVSGGSCVLILASCGAIFGLSDFRSSRFEELAVVAAIVGIAAAIHGSLMLGGRVFTAIGPVLKSDQEFSTDN